MLLDSCNPGLKRVVDEALAGNFTIKDAWQVKIGQGVGGPGRCGSLSGGNPDIGLPADLLANRPDIRASGLRLRAADWQINPSFFVWKIQQMDKGNLQSS